MQAGGETHIVLDFKLPYKLYNPSDSCVTEAELFEAIEKLFTILELAMKFIALIVGALLEIVVSR